MVNSVPSSRPEAHKRRSTRIVQAVPLTITGVDALGRPFQERTSTLIVNCHGCRYQSKHYVLKNMWITIEVPHPEAGHEPRSVRGKVMWIQRPRTVRELFQVGIELEIAGNLWGIAFPPPDWFPFPEDAAAPPEIPAPHVAEVPAPAEHEHHHWPPESASVSDEESAEEEAEESAEEPGEAAESNVRTMPGGNEPSLVLARQMTRLVNEAKQQLQDLARESAVQAVAAEAGPLLAALQSQLQQAAKQSLDAAAERATHSMVEQAAQAGESQLQQLREFWNGKLQESVDQAGEALNARLSEVEAQRRVSFVQGLEAETQRAIENLHRVTQEFQARLGDAEGGVTQFVRRAEEAAAPAVREIEQRLRTHSDEAHAQFQEFERAVRQWNEQMTAAASAAQSSIQARLDAGLDDAGKHLHAKLESSLESSSREASERLARQLQAASDELAGVSRNTVEQVAAEAGLRISALGQSMLDAGNDVERKLAELRGTLDHQTSRTQEMLSQVEAASRDVQEQYRQFEALDQAALQEMERRSSTLLEYHTHELSRRADAALAAWTDRLQPAMEDSGRQALSRLGAQLETEFDAHLRRAGQMLERLDNQVRSADENLRKHQDDLGKVSDQSMQGAIARMQDAIGRLEHNLEEAGRNASTKWLAELDTKATETTHAAFESLFKTAEWYEKKAYTQMQSVLDKGVEQTSDLLRKKAGELSGMFAAELDHYSRSYVEHTHGQVEEVAREALEGVRKQASEFSASSSAAIQQQTQNQTEAAMAQFRNKAGVTVGQTASQLEALAAQARTNFDAHLQNSQAQLHVAIGQELQDAAAKSRGEMAAQAAAAKEDVRAEGSRQEDQLRQALDALGNQFIDNFKQRLENTSNSWLLATAAKLNQQSDQHLAELSRVADARLRETAGQVFANVGETLRKRLLDLTAPMPSEANPPLPSEQQVPPENK